MDCSSSSSNLQRFLDSTTPMVPSRTIPQSRIHDINHPWHPTGEDLNIDSFELKDLWRSYTEWSAFGACTKVVLANGDILKQYYVPYLSAIQIYTDPTILRTKSSVGSCSLEFESDSWSDIDSSSDRLSRSLSDNSSKTWDNMSDDNYVSLNQETTDTLWTPLQEKFGHLYLKYFEECSMNWRIPMMDKINELAKDYPALMTLRSHDVSPASWMAVAWYPIYHIPSISNIKDLSTCFLTYHTLSSSFLDNKDKLSCRNYDKISLSPFGFATYKLHGDLWLNPRMPEYVRFGLLQSAAHSWLKQLSVYHHDLSFFTHHSTP